MLTSEYRIKRLRLSKNCLNVNSHCMLATIVPHSTRHGCCVVCSMSMQHFAHYYATSCHSGTITLCNTLHSKRYQESCQPCQMSQQCTHIQTYTNIRISLTFCKHFQFIPQLLFQSHCHGVHSKLQGVHPHKVHKYSPRGQGGKTFSGGGVRHHHITHHQINYTKICICVCCFCFHTFGQNLTGVVAQMTLILRCYDNEKYIKMS